MTVQDVFMFANPSRNEILKKVITCYRDVSLRAESLKPIKAYAGKTQVELENEIIERYTEGFNKAYDDILNTKVVCHSDTICNVIYNKNDTFYDVNCIYKEEFLNRFDYNKPPIETFEDVENSSLDVIEYSFMFEHREDVLGYTMSEVSLELYPLIDIVAALLWELTWFGYSNEDVEKALKAEKDYLESEDDEEDDIEMDDDILEDEDSEDNIYAENHMGLNSIEKYNAINNRVRKNAYYRRLYEILKGE